MGQGYVAVVSGPPPPFRVVRPRPDDDDDTADAISRSHFLNQQRRNAWIAAASAPTMPAVLLQAEIVKAGEKVADGMLIEGVGIAWSAILKELERDPDFLFKIEWRRMEELIAAAYDRDGWKVTLTPRSNDGGKDVIATRTGVGSVRIFDQVKAYKRGHLVTLEEVSALVGVITTQGNVSKGVVTTTSDFAPGVYGSEDIKRLMPYRLELKNGQQLLEWLKALRS